MTRSSYPTSYRVGSVLVEPNVVLAPMEGVTDLPFRRLVRSIGGPGLTCTEFVPGAGLSREDARVLATAAVDPDERPVAIQLYGRDPALMAEGARVVEGLGATICDVNMGCPSKKVCAHSGGSALMREPSLAARIVERVASAVSIPVTVKMRSGFDAANRNAPELARACVEAGAQAVAVHWRTRADGYGGERDVSTIAATVAAVTVPVLANGDVVSVEAARAMFDDTGCAGVMVGRGAMRNPWLLRQIADWLQGREPVAPGPLDRLAALLRYVDDVQAYFAANPRGKRSDPELGALSRLKMIVGQTCMELPDADALRVAVQRSTRRAEAERHLGAYFHRLADRRDAA